MKKSHIASILLAGSVVLFGVGCGGGSSSSSTDTTTTQSVAKITGTFENMTDTTASGLLLQADSTNPNITLEVYDIDANGELVKDNNAKCQLTGSDTYECSVEPNGEYVVKITQALPDGKYAVLNTTAVVKEGTAEANVTKVTTLVTQVIVQKVRESLEELKDYGIGEEVIQDIIEKIIPVVEQTVEEKIQSGEIQISDTDVITTDVNVTAPETLTTEAAVVSSDVDKNVTVVNTEILQDQITSNDNVVENARLVAIKDYLNGVLQGYVQTNPEFVDKLAELLDYIDQYINITESMISNYGLDVESIKNKIIEVKNELNENFALTLTKYNFFENPLFVDAINQIQTDPLTIKGTIQLLLVDGILQDSTITFGAFNAILQAYSQYLTEYKKPLIVFTDNGDGFVVGIGSVYGLFTNDLSNLPDVSGAKITYTDQNGNTQTSSVTLQEIPVQTQGVIMMGADLSSYNIKDYSNVTLEVTFDDGSVSHANFVYVPFAAGSTDVSGEFEITSASIITSDTSPVDYILTWNDVASENYGVIYKVDQTLPEDYSIEDVTYCDYIDSNHCYIETAGLAAKIKIFEGNNTITVTPQLVDQNGNIVAILQSASKTVQLMNSSAADVNVTFRVSGSVRAENPADYKVALIRNNQVCDDSGCQDDFSIVQSVNVNSDGSYVFEVNASEIFADTSTANNLNYIFGAIQKDVNEIVNPWDFYWPDNNFVVIYKDYYTGTFMIDEETPEGSVIKSLYEANSDQISLTFTIDEAYAADEKSEDENITSDYDENTTVGDDENTTVNEDENTSGDESADVNQTGDTNSSAVVFTDELIENKSLVIDQTMYAFSDNENYYRVQYGEEVESGTWLIDQENGQLILMPDEADQYEIYLLGYKGDLYDIDINHEINTTAVVLDTPDPLMDVNSSDDLKAVFPEIGQAAFNEDMVKGAEFYVESINADFQFSDTDNTFVLRIGEDEYTGTWSVDSNGVLVVNYNGQFVDTQYFVLLGDENGYYYVVDFGVKDGKLIAASLDTIVTK